MSRAAFGCVWFRRLGFSFRFDFFSPFARVLCELGWSLELGQGYFLEKIYISLPNYNSLSGWPFKLLRLAFRPSKLPTPHFLALCQFMPSKWMEMSYVLYTRLNSIETLENALLFKREITRFSL
jgi:hypothetical protein